MNRLHRTRTGQVTHNLPVAIATVLGLLFVASASTALAQTFDPGGLKLMKVRPEQKPDDLAGAVWPTGVIDVEQIHYLNQNNLTALIVAVANPHARNIVSGTLICDLPQRVELKTVNANLLWNTKETTTVRRDGRTYARHRIVTRWSRDTIPKGKLGRCWWARYQPPTLWVTTDAAPGSQLGRVFLRFEYQEAGKDAKTTSPESSVGLAVLPQLHAKTPRIAKSGVMGRGPNAIGSYENDAAAEHEGLLANYIKNMGCNIHMCGLRQSSSLPGLARWSEGRNYNQLNRNSWHNLGELLGVRDGFRVDRDPGVPEEIRAIGKNGQRRTHVAPWAIYRRHEWIQKNVLDELARSIAEGNYEGLWANWEPQTLLNEWDYSEQTRREFIKHSGLPAEEVEQLWLDDLVKKHREKWDAFRNWELGQCAKLYSETIHNAGKKSGRDAWFTLCAPQDNYFIYDSFKDASFQMLSGGDLPAVFQTWSYHHVPKSDSRYPYNDRMGWYLVARAGWLRRYCDEQLGANRKSLVSCVYGHAQTGGRAGYFVPEDLAWRHLGSVMAGCNVAINYAEWTIWDGRYASEMARANTRIARWEDYLLRGKTQTKHIVIPVSPYPQTIPETITPDAQNMSGLWGKPEYLFSFEYEKDGSRLIVLGNNWHFGDCFIKLKSLDLDAHKQYVLWEPEQSRAFANTQGEIALSAEELATGLIVHAPATRWAAFLIQPYQKGKDYGTAVLPAKVQEVMKQRHVGLEQSVKRSAEFR